MARIVGHLDMDAFFASVEERDHDWLRGAPIVVGADPEGGVGRGVVSTANYAARKYGIHSAMPISKAWRLAQEAKKRGEPETYFLSPGFGRYRSASNAVMEILRTKSPQIEEASIDEAYFDLSFCKDWREAERICKAIKKEIKNKERLTASIGIGPNKLIAKIASDAEKPDGLTVVPPERVADFLAPLSARTIPGIGPKAEQKLIRKKIATIRDLRTLSLEVLKSLFGVSGATFYRRARGEDSRAIETEHEIKSIGEQTTFHHDTRESELLFSALGELCVDVRRRLKRSAFDSFRTVVVTVRFADFETLSRSHTAKTPLSTQQQLEQEAMKLLMPFLDKRNNPRSKAFRLLGVRIEKLS